MAKKNKGTNSVALITISEPTAVISEQYRTIRSNIQFASVDKELKTIVITSSGPGEGKSTTSANLAVTFARSGKKVLLVDADLRKPTVALTFKLANTYGLSTMLGDRNADPANCIQESGMENLWVLTSGPKPPNPSEVLDSKRMLELIEQFKQQFDLIIFDMPPVATVTDAQILASKTDGTLLVVRERTTSKQSLAKAKDLLRIANANVLGVVYNAAKNSEENYYYYG